MIVLVLAGCGHPGNSIATCEDALGGVWHADDATWFVLDHGLNLEAYPMTPDVQGPPDMVVAPRVLELQRDETGKIVGEIRRRYMRRAGTCEARVPVHVTACHGDTLDVVTSDIVAPLGFAPCRWPAAEPARVLRWHHE